jgi:hypothetical protein
VKAVEFDSALLGKIICLFSIAPEARKGGKSLECFSQKNSDRTLWSKWPDAACVSGQFKLQADARERGSRTGASDPSRNQRVQSNTHWYSAWRRADRTCGVSGHMQRVRSNGEARPVSSQQLSDTRVLGFPTDASGPSWNRSVWSGTQRGRTGRRADQTL